MATKYRPATEKRQPITAKPQPDIDRDKLRDDIDACYENTLRYLGR